MRNVSEVMSNDPACCLPETKLQDVAKMMVDHDCGEIPIVDRSNKPIGVITDRDIVCRTVAAGKNPLDHTAKDCMSGDVVTVTPETSLEECCSLMEEHQIRRVPVVDKNGACCGMVSQADVALKGSQFDAAELVQDVSRPSR